MNNLDKQYQDLLQDILDNGHQKGDRTGTGTISVFGRQIRHKMSEGFPLITTKKMYTKGIITELLWFLRGDTNIKFLVDNDCHIWDGDAYKAYLKNWKPQPVVENELHWLEQELVSDRPLPKDMFIHCIKTDDEFAKQWGELGPIYGKQWRSWEGIDKESFLNTDNIEDPLLGGRGVFYSIESIDQIQNAINDLKTNPDSRRIIVSAWKVDEINQMTLPPCHNFFQFYTRELSLEERNRVAINKHPLISPELMTVETLDSNSIPTRAISLMWNQRSVDTFLGLPFNIASYGLLLEIVAKMVNMIPEELIGNLGDTHLYSNHIDQAKEQIGELYTHEERKNLLKDAMSHRIYNKTVNELMPFGGGMSEYYESYNIPRRSREPYPLPKLGFNKSSGFFNELSNDLALFNNLDASDFMIENYKSYPTIKAPLSN
jgi:thymidylate synthase